VLVSLLLCAHALRPCAALLQCTTPGRDGAACFALGQLYSSAVGDAWTERGGWADAAAGVATDYCSFEGVTCDGAGVVTGLCAPLRRGAVRLRKRSARCCGTSSPRHAAAGLCTATAAAG
jgi:hypothetical protein